MQFACLNGEKAVKNNSVDFSQKILSRKLLDAPASLEFEDRLKNLFNYLCQKHNQRFSQNICASKLQIPYAREYLTGNTEDKCVASIARVILYLRMESGRPVSYAYKKLDQDISTYTRKVFDDEYYLPLKFSKAELIEAELFATKFGVRYDERLTPVCKKFLKDV